jgi:hypothetical protein
MGQLKVFISYSSQDKSLAGLFKQCFEEYAGFSVFLAHEDIAPALEWELKIIKNLKEADVIVPLITDNYRDSEFTDQEIGMALAWNKIIIPIKLSDINPYGFIKKIQALKCQHNYNKIINAVATIVFVLTENKEFNKFKEVVVDSVIEAFNNSNSFRTTRIIIGILTKIKSFNSKQINGLKKAIRNNDQVYNEIYALPDFKRTLENNLKILIDS